MSNASSLSPATAGAPDEKLPSAIPDAKNSFAELANARQGNAHEGGVAADEAAPAAPEIGGPKGPEPTRYGDWERKGRCIDF